jgi:hypothetical protein
MKKFLALVALAFVAVSWVAPAHAGRWVTEDLRWKKYNAATAYPDSFAVAAKVGFGADTTQVFPLANCPVPTRSGSAAADSVNWLAFYVGGATSAPTSDSIYVGPQVSMDGISWVGLASLNRAFLAATTIPPVASYILVEMNSSNQFGVMVKAASLDVSFSSLLAGATSPTDIQLFGYNYIRFIVTWSIVDRGSLFTARIGHWEQGTE